MRTGARARTRTVTMITAGLLLGFAGAVQLAQEPSAERQAQTARFRVDDACRVVRPDKDDTDKDRGDEDDRKGRRKRLECRTPSGSGVARGDFNGDGFGDLAIGVPNEDLTIRKLSVSNAGQVTIIYGSQLGLKTVQGEGEPPIPHISEMWHQNVLGIDDFVESDDQFGSALVSGDFNGDTFGDLAVLVPGERDASGAKRGAVQVIFGSDAGLTAVGDQFIAGTSFSLNGQSLFLLDSAGWGDFNNDGFGDLVVEAATTQDGAGASAPTAAAIVLPGSPTGFNPATAVIFSIPDASVLVTGDILFFFVDMKFSAGDVDGNLFDDLVIGKRGAAFGGAIEVLKFSSTGLTAPVRQVFDQRSSGLDDAASGDDFGATVTVGNFDDDVFDDIAVGVPGEDFGTVSDAGAVEVLMGSAAGPNPADALRLRQGAGGFPGTAQNNDRFGRALAAGDFNGDSRKDLAIGVPNENVGTVVDAGQVNVIYASVTGLSVTAGPGVQLFSQDSSGIAETDDAFGSQLTAWNFGLGAQADLAIGVPLENVGTIVDAGAVDVIYGSVSGLSASRHQFWTANSSGVPDTAEANDHFGRAVY